MELIKIVLDDGKEFVFRRDSLCNNILDSQIEKKFIKISEDKDYFINTSKIAYIEMYEGGMRKKKKKT